MGSSGSGKSTLLRILMRLYDVQSGAVKLEGMDVRDLTQDSLRNSVAVVPQDTVLFNDTCAFKNTLMSKALISVFAAVNS